MAAILRFNQVAFQYSKGEPMFTDLSFHIEQGQWVTIVGPNGSGKSTLTKLMNGLLVPQSGTIQIGGVKLDGHTVSDIRGRVGYLFQNPDNQFIANTVQDDMAFGMENRCLPQAEMQRRIDQVSVELGIRDWLGRHPSSLSGGQKQRVAIAGLLVLNPEVMIWDEATSMLDEQARRECMIHMRQLRAERGFTIVSVTHDAEEIMASDRVLVVKDGQLVADLSPMELFAREELMEECRLRPPFAVELSLELRRRGVDVDICRDEEELVNALWPSCPVKN
ncbi:energy-coupling factor transporter ATPase [Paenibacillus assamensis]|uniref:energy-coupling factor transporter ATPase n=1 Tax=Paenibacillus assamensis TaxID=311244 RepID=UPI00048E7A52|nr:energy-coupling factor transporter ATPase [Paenibacillus assamensis]